VNFQIHQSECISVASDEASGYKVHVEYKRTSENDFKQLEGCGNYILDYRLNDIWVLEKLNGTEVSLEDFAKEIPTLEINSSNKTFFGYAGCNRMNGSLFSENDLLRFTKIVITKMMCQPHNKESEFLKALQSTITYNIEHNQLKLSNPDRELLIFKKID
jgi:heat shock protein HslJ